MAFRLGGKIKARASRLPSKHLTYHDAWKVDFISEHRSLKFISFSFLVLLVPINDLVDYPIIIFEAINQANLVIGTPFF